MMRFEEFTYKIAELPGGCCQHRSINIDKGQN